MKFIQKKEPIVNSFLWQFAFKKLACCLPEDTWVPKHVGKTYQMYVLGRNCAFDWYN